MTGIRSRLEKLRGFVKAANSNLVAIEPIARMYGDAIGLDGEIISRELREAEAVGRFWHAGIIAQIEGQHRGVAILASAGADENAFVSQKFGSSAFGHYFKEALSGRAANADGIVTIRSAYEFIQSRMGEISEFRQRPVLHTRGDVNEAVLTGIAIPTESVARRTAIVIGMNRFTSTDIPNLAYAEDDARGVGEIFEAHGGFDVSYMIGNEATHRAIVSRLSELSHDATLGAILVYFTGHAFVYDQVLNIAVRDSSVERRAYFLSIKTLISSLESGIAPLKMIVLDTCFAGRAIDSGL